MKKTEVFEITGGSGQRQLQALKNRCDIRVMNEKEYFGLTGTEDGPAVVIYRTVDYEEKQADILLGDAAYKMPIC